MKRDSEPFDHDAERLKHMKRRRAQGLTYREIAEEFDTSRSTAHRHVRQQDGQEEEHD